MEIYSYKAIDHQGRIQRGRINALNVADLELRLQRMGLDLITYKDLKTQRSLNLFGSSSIKRADLIGFCFHFEQLLEVGVPILEALSDLRDSIENPRLREVTAVLIESIQGGKNLSEAMRDFPFVFNAVFVNLIKAGESSSQLPQVLRLIIENLKWQDEQAAYMKRLFIYPLFVSIAVVSTLFFLMTALVPELSKFVKAEGQELPWHTKVLILASHGVADYGYLALLVLGIGVALVFLNSKRNPAFGLRIDVLVLKIPVVGPLLKKMILTRFANYFALMYASGIAVLECLRIGEEIAGNKAIQLAIREAGRQIAEGAGISAAFAATGLFPPLVIRMLRVGENTGSLESALLNVSYFYNRDVKESVERLQAIIEPAMTATLGIIIAWIVFSILGPIYDLITRIKI